MAARAYWSGHIRLALVSIPVQVFPATRSSAKIAFHQVHEPTGKRIRYQKIVPGHGPVDTDEIVKGYEVEKNQYVLLHDEEVDEIKLEARKTLDLVQFVDATDIGPIYYDRPFFVKPDEDETAQEAYVTLREALRDTGKVGLGQIVVRGKGSLVALKPCNSGLLLETLRYADEVRKAESFFADIPDVKPDKELVGLARELIERKAGPFKPEAFEDAYTRAVRELIDAKLEDRPPEQIEAPMPSAKVIDLMEALKRSVSRDDGKGKRGAAKSAKRGGAKPKSRSKSKSKSKSARGKKAA